MRKGTSIPKKTPVHMLWKTYVIGDAIVQTCGKTGRVFTKWARRIPNVSFTVPASWAWWPEKEERHEYSYDGSDELASEQLQKQMEELHEVFSQGISDELPDTVFERTWKIVQEQIGKGSALQDLKNRIWSLDTHTHTHTLYGT